MADEPTNPDEPLHATDASLERDVAHAGKTNYLGDPEVVSGILSAFVSDALNRFDVYDRRESCVTDMAECAKLADVFLGNNPAYAPMPAWNAPGQIDSFVVDVMGVESDDPKATLVAFFAGYLGDNYDLYNQMVIGELAENTDWQVQALMEWARNALLGIAEPTVDAAFLASVQDE